MPQSAVFTTAVTLLSSLMALKKGANALYIGILSPLNPSTFYPIFLTTNFG